MAIHMQLLIVPKLLFKNCHTKEVKKPRKNPYLTITTCSTTQLVSSCFFIVLLIYNLIELQLQIQTSKPLDFPRFTVLHLHWFTYSLLVLKFFMSPLIFSLLQFFISLFISFSSFSFFLNVFLFFLVQLLEIVVLTIMILTFCLPLLNLFIKSFYTVNP